MLTIHEQGCTKLYVVQAIATSACEMDKHQFRWLCCQVSSLVSKGNNFSDLLFAPQDKDALSQGGSNCIGKNLFHEELILSLKS